MKQTEPENIFDLKDLVEARKQLEAFNVIVPKHILHAKAKFRQTKFGGVKRKY